jgi:hypothetical protein
MTESTTSGNSSKRRRVADGLLHCRRLSDLPIEPLTHVATFLAAPSRAIFAVALTTVHHSFQGDGDGISAQKIAGFEWDTLDFGHIEKELAERLSDDDMNAILRCIDAVHKLKILKLTNCINITGVGLEPLRGSRIIAKIDMSLVGEHKSPLLNPEPPISRDVVLPILDSILDGEGSALKQIQFPKKWRILNNRFHPSNQDFYRFIRRFNEIMESHGAIRCPDCNGEVGYRGFCEVSVSQTSTCFACSKQECNDCESTRGLEGTLLICSTCEKCYCSDCSTMYVCRHCQHDFCRACSPPAKCSDLNVMTRIIISAGAVDAIVIDVRDCIVEIAAVNINAMSVISSAVASASRIMNARIVTSDTVMNAPRRQASIQCTHVEIVAENNALAAVYVFLIQPNVAALGAST